MIRESRAIHICIVLALAMVAFDVSVYRLEQHRATVYAAIAVTPQDIVISNHGTTPLIISTVVLWTTEQQREQVRLYPTCPWWIDAELWWREDCPTGKAPAVPEALR